ncbi:MAG TPA: hypothetical protein VEV63_18625 [Streptosporangiaceae bacterium]|nr:hypothetical protein [Streptosporangiaceae bacterium]
MAQLDELLTQALHDIAADAPTLPPLSAQLRRRVRTGRIRTALACVAAIAVASAGLVAGALAVDRAARSLPETTPSSRPAWTRYTLNSVELVAVGGPRASLLYVAAGDYPSATLSVFSRASGRLISRISVPGKPVVLRAGPGGSVWLGFGPDVTGASTGLWLLNSGLTEHSSLRTSDAEAIDLFDVLPIGPADAVVAGRSLMDLHMPGFGGTGSLRDLAALPTDHGFARHVIAMAISRLGSRYAALQVNNYLRYRMVIAGGSGAVFNPGNEVAINSVASAGEGLWLATGPNEQAIGINVNRPGPAVIHLNAQLKDTTPASVRRYRDFRLSVELVWAFGHTVVVSTDIAARPLDCFSYHDGVAGPIVRIPARLPPQDVALSREMVYAADAFGVIGYRLPPQCL